MLPALGFEMVRATFFHIFVYVMQSQHASWDLCAHGEAEVGKLIVARFVA